MPKFQVKAVFKDPKEVLKVTDDGKEQDIYDFVIVNFEKNPKGVLVVKSWKETNLL